MQDRDGAGRREFLRAMATGAGALLTAGLIGGCGGGGGGGASAPSYNPNLAQFVPNYANVITINHWPVLPVRVFFANDLTVTPQGGTLTHVNDVVRAGFNRWAAATGGVVGYVEVGTAGEANVQVGGVLVPRPSGDGETGSTSVDATGSTINLAQTQIFVWPDITVGELLIGQRTTACHEFGHILGIAGHSDNPGDVMYPSHLPTQDVPLSARDINTIKTLYYYLFS